MTLAKHLAAAIKIQYGTVIKTLQGQLYTVGEVPLRPQNLMGQRIWANTSQTTVTEITTDLSQDLCVTVSTTLLNSSFHVQPLDQKMNISCCREQLNTKLTFLS